MKTEVRLRNDSTGTSGSPLVSVKDLYRSFPLPGGGVVRAVDGVSFDIFPGEIFGIVGESGSGKSTVSRLLLALDKPSSGQVTFDGTNITGLSGRELRPLRRQMQMVFQDPLGALNRRKRVEQIVSLPLVVHSRLGRAARAARVRELLDLVGLRPEMAKRFPHEMSGGQCQRVGIARALAMHPRLVVLDEAVSAVDVSIQAQILNLLKDLQRQLGLTYVFVSHDLSLVRYMSDRIAVMYQGKVVELANRDSLFSDAHHPYTKALIAAIPSPEPQSREAQRQHVAPQLPAAPRGCSFAPNCPSAQPVCISDSPQRSTIGAGHTVTCHVYGGTDAAAL